MSSAEFTPGPWTVDDHEVGAVMSGNICVTRGKDAGRSLGEISANAHLIAAAPELYAALKNVMDWIGNWDPNFSLDDEWPSDADKARAALAKARGESS